MGTISSHKKNPYKRNTGEVRVGREGIVMTEAETEVMCFEDVGRATAKKYRWPRDVEKSKKMDSLLKVSRKNQPCQFLDFSPIKLILDFDLQNSKRIILRH